ncbi:MAG: hypothetical protein ACI9XO_001675 [Paraglaciecola sp.]|jgi:hypothetical protein
MKLSIFSFLLLSIFTFSACQKGTNFDKKEKDKDKKYFKAKDHCFDMVYPVTWTMPDGSEITSNDEDAMWTVIKNWYETNANSKEKPVLNYPVDVVFKNGLATTVVNEDEMIVAKKECYGKEECFDLVFPISFLMPDNSTISGEKGEVLDAMKIWYEANPDSKEKPTISYPVEIIYENGSTAAMANEAAMHAAKDHCDEQDG